MYHSSYPPQNTHSNGMLGGDKKKAPGLPNLFYLSLPGLPNFIGHVGFHVHDVFLKISRFGRLFFTNPKFISPGGKRRQQFSVHNFFAVSLTT